MEHENKDSKHDIDIVITEPEKEESYDETDAKLFSGKLLVTDMKINLMLLRRSKKRNFLRKRH